MTDLQDDIVERLLDRTGDQHVPDSLLLEAADLITSLRAQVAAAERKGMMRAAEICETMTVCNDNGTEIEPTRDQFVGALRDIIRKDYK